MASRSPANRSRRRPTNRWSARRSATSRDVVASEDTIGAYWCLEVHVGASSRRVEVLGRRPAAELTVRLRGRLNRILTEAGAQRPLRAKGALTALFSMRSA